jgi:hypothetical protein
MDDQSIRFDTSGLDAASAYLRDRTVANLQALASSPGGDFAYRHYQWSNMDTHTTVVEFWSARLSKFTAENVNSANFVGDYLLSQNRSRWLPGVLDYLPEGHVFDATVYLNLGYDNIAMGGDAAINLGHPPFHADCREAIYYLMHELAHAGYLAYHETPDLTKPRTFSDLAANVRFLTHLEGMGVITPLKLRRKEGGLGDPDYVALEDPIELQRRVHVYLEKYRMLEYEKERAVKPEDLLIYDGFSRKPYRLWYVTGCHMAQVIEAVEGRDMLRKLVREGSDVFFDTYRCTPDPLGVRRES